MMSHILSCHIATHKHSNLRQFSTCLTSHSDCLQDLIQLLILITETQPHISTWLILLGHLLLHISINSCHCIALLTGIHIHTIQHLSRCLEELIIKVHHIRKATVVCIKHGFIMPRKLCRNSRIQKLPIRSSPSIYTLLHIADYQILATLRLAILKKRLEILPLHI